MMMQNQTPIRRNHLNNINRYNNINLKFKINKLLQNNIQRKKQEQLQKIIVDLEIQAIKINHQEIKYNHQIMID